MPRLPRLRRGARDDEPFPPSEPSDAPDQPTVQLDAPPQEGEGGAPAVAQGGVPAVPDGGAASAVPPEGGDEGTSPARDGLERARRFRERRRMRRRLRELRRMRELALRDLGGLVFELRRFGRERDDLVQAKLDALASVDGELRALERALEEERTLVELREPGIAACPRCGTLHGTDARFCPGCGVPLRGAPAGPLVEASAPADPAGTP